MGRQDSKSAGNDYREIFIHSYTIFTFEYPNRHSVVIEATQGLSFVYFIFYFSIFAIL
jgi:hypothetical protein